MPNPYFYRKERARAQRNSLSFLYAKNSMHSFFDLFRRSSQVKAHAPGRVNLIGEHTDYNGGFVLPTAIPQGTQVEIVLRDDGMARVWSAAFANAGISEFRIGTESRHGDWLDYIQGVTWLLGREGCPCLGFDARIESSVPLGSGLSSSASLTVALMRALRLACGWQLDDLTIARFGQRVENDFTGARVGIMDPMAASLADQGTALFLDARDLSFERVPLPPGADLVVIHSGVSHRLTTGGYNTRRAECEEACRLFGVSQLRDLGTNDLPRVEALADPWRQRARHVITENDRVLRAVAAMKRGDLAELGRLFYDSHASMRDDYQVSVSEIDHLVELARLEKDVFGCRLTGGGFGGSVVMLARAGTGRRVAETIAARYDKDTGCRARILVPQE